MAYSISHFQIKDFDKFKSVFDESQSALRATGVKNVTLYRSTSNPNEVVILQEWDDLSKARQWHQSADLKDRLQRGGLVEGSRQLTYFDNWGSTPGMSTQR